MQTPEMYNCDIIVDVGMKSAYRQQTMLTNMIYGMVMRLARRHCIIIANYL